MIRLGVVTGLAAEARLAGDAGLAALVAGGDPRRAAACAEQLVVDGAAVLVSFGLAGGLDPALAPGALVVADQVIDGSRHGLTDAALTGRLRGAIAGAVGGAIIGVDRPLATAPAKRAARAATGAVAVDTESHAIARIAQASGVSFVALRAIADPAGMDLPPAALVAIGADGGIVWRRVVGSLFAHPTQTVTVLRLGLASRRAFASLRRTAAVLAEFAAA